MDVEYITDVVIIPATGSIDRTGRIKLADQLNDVRGIKLSPTLVEWHPHYD